MRPAMSHLAVGDLLEDTIMRSAKSQNGADDELTWLRRRLDNERRDPRARGKRALENGDRSSGSGNRNQQQLRSVAKTAEPMDKENAAAAADPAGNKASPPGMSVVQLRRFLRAIGQPTVGLKQDLTARVENAVSSGVVKTFVENARTQPRPAVECAGERRKTEAVLAAAESMLNLDKTAATSIAAGAPGTTAPKLPLRESLSSPNNEGSLRSSARSSIDKTQLVQQTPATPMTSKLSGPEQDAVVAKIRSAAKRSASPEKQLPYQDDDTPNTKGARLKKEMEDRLARQRAAKQQQQQPAPAMPPAEAEALPTPVTPPSLRPPVPSSPAPMPPSSPLRAAHPPPPPTVEAPLPQSAAISTTPPEPEGAAPRPADLAHKISKQASRSAVVPVPASLIESALVPGTNEGTVADGVAPLTVSGGQDGVNGSSGVPQEEQTSPNKAFGSPSRHRAPATTPSRKASPFAKDSISSTGPSGLKAAASKAFNRVAVKPPPSTPVDTPSPTGSFTQDAFAKFRAMDSNSKKGSGSIQSFKVRPSPSPKGPLSISKQPATAGTATSGQMLPPHRLDFGSSKTSTINNNSNNNNNMTASSPASSFKRGGDATGVGAGEGLSAVSAAKARAEAAKVKAEAAALKARTLAEQAAADEARRDAQAKAELKAREAALKAAAEREERVRKQEEEEVRKKEEEDRKKKEADKKRRAAERLAERAAAAEALRKAEDKKRAEKRAAMEQKAAAAAAKEKADEAARKEEEEAKRAAAASAAAAKPVKPPTPPRVAVKPPPTPPRPGHKGQAQAPPPPTPPRPATAAAAAAQVHPASSWTPSKSPGSAAEARQLALAKKKEEIAKRMEEIRKKKTEVATSTPSPTPAAATNPPPSAAAVKPAPTPVPAPVKSAPAPVETKEERESYDAYDVEPESGSESGEEEEEAAPEIQEPQEPSDKSAIPDWARGKALAKILDKQYGGPNPLNPDKIFPEFFTCNLEHIFNTKKQKWDRSSSGNWHTDRLTIAEKLAYQRAMGFDK